MRGALGSEEDRGGKNKRVKECMCVCVCMRKSLQAKQRGEWPGYLRSLCSWQHSVLTLPSLSPSVSLSPAPVRMKMSSVQLQPKTAGRVSVSQKLQHTHLCVCVCVCVCGVCGHEQILPFYNYVRCLSTIVVLVSWGMCVSHTPFVRLF